MRILSDYVSSEPSLPPASVAAFCAQTTPYLPEADTEAAFVVAMADITRWHQQRSPWYRAFLAASGIAPETNSEAGWTPSLPSDFQAMPVPTYFILRLNVAF